MGLLYGIYLRIKNFLVFFFLVVLIPGFPPKTEFPFTGFSVDKPQELTGPLALNTFLDNAERLLEGRVAGPEHLVMVGKDIYTGLNNGEVVRINGDHITHVAKFGQPCEGIHQERKCGRPLGIEYDANRNYLIVSDAYYGIWEVDLKSGSKKQLISPETIIQGERPRKAALFNSLALHSNGDIYFTDSSSDFHLENGLFTVMANPSGRLIHWDRKKNVATALLDELAFANGLLISPNEDFIVVAETIRGHVIKYNLKGAKRGTVEPFLPALPGHPDNLTPSTNGFWVPLVVSRDAENPSLMASLQQVPLMRKFLIRLLYLIEFPLETIQRFAPNEFTEKMLHKWGHFMMASGTYPARQSILKVDWNGNIIGSLHGSDHSTGTVAHVLEAGDYLYVGSPFTNFVGRVKLNAAAKKLLQMEEKQKTAPPTTTPPPPTTTTTPKPTTTTTTTTPKPTTTPPPPTTTTTTPKPTTAKPPTTTTPQPKPTASKPPQADTKEQEPAPVHEKSKDSPPPPAPEKLKVIKKGGVGGEL